MKIKNKSKSIRIREAAIRDGVNYIVGLSKIPIPLEVVKELITIKKEKAPLNFVDWQLENWPQIYHNELDSVVKLPYLDKDYLLPNVLIFDNTKRKLPLSSIKLQPNGDLFELDNDIRSLTEDSFAKLLNYLRKKRMYSNEQNLRLANIIEEGEEIILKVQPVEYRDFVHTNLVLDAKPKTKKQTLRDYIHSNGKLNSLENTQLANHLGVEILLFTADGSLIMQERSKKVAFRTNELCSAASGAVSLNDVLTEMTLEEMPKLREAFEEIGISKIDVPTNQIFFLGINRDIILGGKPGMYFFGKTNLSEKQIEEKRKDARDKWESEKLIFFHFGQIAHKNLITAREKHIFLSKVEEFIDEYIDKSSIPLLAAVALWAKWHTEG
jgi:hypothetical protein